MPIRNPGFAIYPAQYLQSNISVCSLSAQGLWLRMQMMMAASKRFGYLEWAGKPTPDLFVVRALGVELEEYIRLFAELEESGCIEREPRTRIIFCRSLVVQAAKRAKVRARVQRHRRRFIGVQAS